MAYGNEKFDKRWEIVSVPVAAPAAGSEWSVTVTAGQVWKVIAVQASLTTSSTVASRIPILKITDGANVVAQSGYGSSIAASQGPDPISWFRNAAKDSSFVGAVQAPLPDGLVLPAGFTIGSNTVNIQAGDTWTAITLLVEKADAF